MAQVFQSIGRRSCTVHLHAKQKGFSLIEISIVTTIIMLIAILGIPAIQSYVIESKVPRVAEELQRFVARMKATTQGFGVTPYSGIDTG
ncbi:MAG: hypothetical protein RLZZ192_119, partial [Pseudomonadota bacterium]